MVTVTGLTLLFILKYTTKYKNFESALLLDNTEPNQTDQNTSLNTISSANGPSE